jgi:hypothetical protein
MVGGINEGTSQNHWGSELCPSSGTLKTRCFRPPVMGSSLLNKELRPLGCVYIQYAKGVSEKLKCIGTWYNIRMIFRMKHS